MLKVATVCSGVEVWKYITEYEGLYQVSNIGRIKSLERYSANQWSEKARFREEKILSYQLTKDGYPSIKLSKNGNAIRHRIHRLVALCFLENPFGKEQVNHINGIKTDNRVENLEWATCSENMEHAYKSGLRTAPSGVDSPYSVFSKQDVLDIRDSFKNGISQIELAKKYNVTMGCISGVCRKRTYANI